MSDRGLFADRSIAVSALTDVGLVRSNNQDAHIVSVAHSPDEWFQRGHLFAVADGMGAHAAGELASKLAIDQIAYLYRKHRDQSPTDAILSAVRAANDEIHRRGQANLSFHNMGTTCSSLLLLPQGAVVAHVGDSRVYRFRKGQLQQLTFDHSLMWEMQQATKAAHSSDLPGIPKNVITRSIGPHPQVSIDLEGPFPIEPGDGFLLCSDGLTGRVDDPEIAGALRHLAPDAAARLLLDLAILRGGKDNITLIVVQVVSPELVTHPRNAPPLTISDGEPPSHQVALWWWIALGFCLLLSVTLFAMGQYLWGWIALGVSVIPWAAIVVQKTGLLHAGGLEFGAGSSLGRGPYTSTNAESPERFRERLRAAVEEAGQAARSRGWWDEPSLDDTVDLAQLAARADQLADLCRQRGRTSPI